ncbi:MAG: hypothetical protein HY721_06730 [Planctomycetes bacterium]|nr:hypothetical protein [Planctomycetota bacterium]
MGGSGEELDVEAAGQGGGAAAAGGAGGGGNTARGGAAEPVRCEIRVRPDGAWEPPTGPRKVAVAHRSPLRPIIRYPEIPARVPGFERLWDEPADLYQVAYAPDEMSLVPGKTYYIEVVASRPDPPLRGR